MIAASEGLETWLLEAKEVCCELDVESRYRLELDRLKPAIALSCEKEDLGDSVGEGWERTLIVQQPGFGRERAPAIG